MNVHIIHAERVRHGLKSFFEVEKTIRFQIQLERLFEYCNSPPVYNSPKPSLNRGRFTSFVDVIVILTSSVGDTRHVIPIARDLKRVRFMTRPIIIAELGDVIECGLENVYPIHEPSPRELLNAIRVKGSTLH